MLNINEINHQYITDENGKKSSVILSVSDFQELLEDIEDLAAVAERRNDPAVSHEDLLNELRADGLL